MKKGASFPPADLRYLKRAKTKTMGESIVGDITSYLQQIYESIAETLPDVKDDGIEYTYHVGGADEMADDAYEDAMKKEIESRKPKIRKKKKGLELHPERASLETRFLPPGCMRDYWEQFVASECKHICFTTFWKTWTVEFPHLRFRSTSSHVQCAVCVHHKIMMRSLANYINARQKQSELYSI